MAYQFVRANSQWISASNPISDFPFTFAGFFNVNNDTQSHGIVSVAVSSSSSFWQLLTAAGAVAGDPLIATSTDATTTNYPATSGTYSANVWNHGAGAFPTSSSRTAYLNASGGSPNTTNVGAPSGLNRLGIGVLARQNLADLCDGRLAEVAIWNVALTDDEITSLSKGFKPSRIRPQSLVFYAPLIRDLIDVKAGLALTNNNSATVADHPRVY